MYYEGKERCGVMLIDFEVENFLSFKNKTTLSLEKGERLRKFNSTHVFDKEGYSLLKNITIFGPNGSGKTNIITAFHIFSQLIKEPTDHIEAKLPYLPFKIDKDSAARPTTFTVRFSFENTVYRYTVSYTAEEIVLEELSTLSNKEVVYFRRTNDSLERIPKHLKEVRRTLRKNKLLLFEGQDKNDIKCISVYQWFYTNLIFGKNKEDRKRLFEILREDSVKKELFVKLMNLADINILDVEVIETKSAWNGDFVKFLERLDVTESVKEILSYDIYFIYKKYDIEGRCIGTEKISYEMESKGTKDMMFLALVMLHSFQKEKVILLDEFDESFHLSLTKALLGVINSEANRNQFIFTTHTLDVLDADLRVDQIYFTEKDFMGVSDLYSLFDFNDLHSARRGDIQFAKRYLKGQFGALPDVDLEGMRKLFEDM